MVVVVGATVVVVLEVDVVDVVGTSVVVGAEIAPLLQAARSAPAPRESAVSRRRTRARRQPVDVGRRVVMGSSFWQRARREGWHRPARGWRHRSPIASLS